MLYTNSLALAIGLAMLTAAYGCAGQVGREGDLPSAQDEVDLDTQLAETGVELLSDEELVAAEANEPPADGIDGKEHSFVFPSDEGEAGKASANLVPSSMGYYGWSHDGNTGYPTYCVPSTWQFTAMGWVNRWCLQTWWYYYGDGQVAEERRYTRGGTMVYDSRCCTSSWLHRFAPVTGWSYTG